MWLQDVLVALSPLACNEQKIEVLNASVGPKVACREARWELLRNLDLDLLVFRELYEGETGKSDSTYRFYKQDVARRRVENYIPLRDFGKLLSLAAYHSIPLINMRAPYLTECLYGGDHGARRSSDVDIAVLPQDVDKLLAVLPKEGFSLCGDGNKVKRKADLGGRCEFRFGNAQIDLHWELTLYYNFFRPAYQANKQKEIWSRANSRDFWWGSPLVLDTIDLILHLAEHAAIQHDLRGKALKNLVEFGLLWNQVQPDPGQCLAVARARGTETALYAVSVAVGDLWGNLCPDGIQQLSAACPSLARAEVFTVLSEHIVKDFKASREPVSPDDHPRSVLSRRMGGILTTATFIDGWRARGILFMSILAPSRQLLTYALDESLSTPQYLTYMFSRHPAEVLIAWPVMVRLIRRQVASGTRSLKGRLRSAIYVTLGTGLVIRYYACNLRLTGLVGKSCIHNLLFRLRLPTVFMSGRLLWVHVAGLGDARAAVNFLGHLHSQAPAIRTFISCGSESALTFLRSQTLPCSVDTISWLPVDLPWLMEHWVKRLKPKAFVGMQGEFWPNLSKALFKEGIPAVYLRVNVFSWEDQVEYPQYVKSLYMEMLSYATMYSVISEHDLRSLRSLGVNGSRIILGGDYRPDYTEERCVDPRVNEAVLLYEGENLCVLTSNHYDEMKDVIIVLLDMLKSGRIRLILAPSDVSVFSSVRRLCRKLGLTSEYFGEAGGEVNPGAQIILFDILGALPSLYAYSAVTIVGDSFPPTFGMGTNYWESLVQGCPVVFGPSAIDDVQDLVRQGVAWQVAHVRDLPRVVNGIVGCGCSDDSRRIKTRGISLGAMDSCKSKVKNDVLALLNLIEENDLKRGPIGYDRNEQ